MDPNGNDPINIESAMSDDTLIVLPPGEYTFQAEAVENGSPSKHATGSPTNFGIVSKTRDPGDVTIRVDEQNTRFLEFRGGKNFLLEGVTFDDRSKSFGSSNVEMVLVMEDGIQLHQLRWEGYQSFKKNLSPRISSEDGEGVVQNVSLTHEAAYPEYPGGIIRANVQGDHEGTLYWRNCEFANAGSNALYAGRNYGANRLEKCVFRNNQISAFRIGGEESYAKNCRVVVDIDNADIKPNGRASNANGAALEGGSETASGTLVENCEFIYKSTTGGYLFEIWGNHGAATFRNCFFRNDTGGRPTIRAESPGGGASGYRHSGPQELTFESCVVLDQSDYDASMKIQGRDGSVVRDCCISGDASGPGILFIDSDGCKVENTNVNVQGDAVETRNSSADRSGVTSDRQCEDPEIL
jgi:hypothetical protein